MRHLSKPRPLLAAFALAASIITVSAPADAAQPVSTFFAFTPPLPNAPPSRIHLAAVAAGFTAAALAAAFLPVRRITPRAVPAASVAPATPIAVGPIYCPLTKRWRDPVSRRFVKTPTV